MADRDISFEPVVHAHLPLLRRWLDYPHWRQWWGDPQEELSYIVEMIEGRDATRPFLFHVDGEPVGYIQYWFVGHHHNEQWTKDHPWLLELPAAAVGVDLSIGEPQLLAQGIGSAVLKAFVARLRREGYATIVIDPEPNNARAIRAYRKAGFAPIPHLQGRTDGVLLMQSKLVESLAC